MSEISKYEAYAKKLQGICDENDLVFKFERKTYPITLTIRPTGGLDGQMSMLAETEENGYISPDAAIIFTVKDGCLTYRVSKTFTISDTLFSKVKNLFKNMHYAWLQYFFRDVIERGVITDRQMPIITDETGLNDDVFAEDMEPLEIIEDDEDYETDDGEIEEIEELDFDSPEVIEATKIVRHENMASLKLLQQRMRIGYRRANALMGALEELGVIGPYNGGKSREVLPYDEPDETVDSAEGAEYEVDA